MIESSAIAQNIEAIQARMAAAAARSGRSLDDVTLVAISKKKPPADILQAYAAGIRHFGENRLEEAQAKIPQVMAQLPDADIQWHMVGHIQSRKAEDVVVQSFDFVHSVDRVKIAQRLSRFAVEQNQTVTVFLEINVSGENAKYGFLANRWQSDAEQRQALYSDIKRLLALPNLQIRGLMTMAPYVAEPDVTRPVFRGLADLRGALCNDFPALALPHLSMGMTNDFEIAIEEGATIVRIGRAIFGERLTYEE